MSLCCAVLQDINSLDVSPNDKLIVSGSQDKTAKVNMSCNLICTIQQHVPVFSCGKLTMGVY